MNNEFWLGEFLGKREMLREMQRGVGYECCAGET